MAASERMQTSCPNCQTELELLRRDLYPKLPAGGGNVSDLPGPITDNLGGGNVVAWFAVLESDGTYVCPECKEPQTFGP
jgi:hypothetical protein